jgi:hypothetical protein
MLLLRLSRHGWHLMLACLPAPVLTRLDAWARRQAQARATRRRQRLAAARR